MSEKILTPTTHQQVREYYGEKLQSSDDLKTSACCSTESMPAHHKEILNMIDDEILEKFYGCGSPIPVALEGKTVLDLGCGSGRDVYLVSRLVGPQGQVIGVDMTESQLAVARKHVDSQMQRFGFEHSNVDFRHGFIEDLAGAGIEDNSVDVVISNCVINLSPNKLAVFAEIFRVLKPGGELFFSDVFADRRIPEELREDPVLYGECLSGALYIEDFRRLLRTVGCPDYRIFSQRVLTVEDLVIAEKVANIRFQSITVRAFKLPLLEDICEDYGQVAIYNGGIKESPNSLILDDHHIFEKGKPMLVCGNSAAMVQETRFGEYFTILGDRSRHFGAFDCAPASIEASAGEGIGSCC